MKVHMKSTLLLMGTFLIGIVFGMILHETFLVHQSKSRANKMRDPQMFIHHFEDVLQPTDAQREEIKKILKKHYNKMMNERSVFQEKMDSLRVELEAVLTDEQKEKLQDSRLWRHDGPPGPFRDKRPFPPGPSPDPFMEGPPPMPPFEDGFEEQ